MSVSKNETGFSFIIILLVIAVSTFLVGSAVIVKNNQMPCVSMGGAFLCARGRGRIYEYRVYYTSGLS